MKNNKSIMKRRKVKAWWITSLALVSFFTIATTVIETVPIINGTFDLLVGGVRPNVGTDYKLYTADYKNKREVYKAANELNEKVVEEGITLLKNENNTLPLKKNAKITVFGKNSTNLVYGGSGSGGGNGLGDRKTLYQSLEDAKIKYNPVMEKFYSKETKSYKRPDNPGMGSIIAGFETGEVPLSEYSKKVKASYKEYNDAAIVVISRIGGEGFDLPRSMKKSYGSSEKINGARDANDHYLQLDQNETDMIKEACNNFSNVIIVLNTPTPMEVGFLDDNKHYAYHENIKGCLWMGLPGDSGVMALGRVLNGTVNPSGRLNDTYARNFKNDPSFRNFGNNNIDGGNQYLLDGNPTGFYYVDYEEGINVGYRYYETRAYEEENKLPSSTWYKDNVVFPFGYGLSYTDFTWTLEEAPARKNLNGQEELEYKVRVKNTGDVAGKDVVELFFTAPYKAGGIEKSHVVLGDFAKTKLLKPGESEVVSLKLDSRDMASYDYNDKNGNGFKGYELENGEYTISISKNAHTPLLNDKLTLENSVAYPNDSTTNHEIKNRFDDVSSGLNQVMTRANYNETMPTTPTEDDRKVTQEFIKSLKYRKNDTDKPWYTDKMPTQAKASVSKDDVTVVLRDLIGLDYDNPKWDELMNQLTVEEMTKLIGTGAYGTIEMLNIGKPITYEPDGPSGFTNFMTDAGPVYNTTFYAAECVMGHTWNKELATEMGKMIGNESLVGDEKGTGLPYSGWYAPAVNIHRSQFAGRNWEYYSEDSYLSGALASAVIKGCKEKGVYTYLKHFVANDQETNRDSNGCIVWVDEQALREIYMKPFEMAVKDAGTTGIMSSFNRLGTTWAGGSYALLTEVLRDEWGFKGSVITDYALARYMNVDQMIRAGGDLCLNQGNKAPSLKDTSATQVSAIRRASKNILYTICNSNAMNKDIIGYKLPLWEELMFIADGVILGGCLVWGAIVIVIEVRKNKKEDDVENSTE